MSVGARPARITLWGVVVVVYVHGVLDNVGVDVMSVYLCFMYHEMSVLSLF